MNSRSDTARLMEGIRWLVRRFGLAERADVGCCGMTVAQAATLEALLGEDGLRSGELSRRLGISASTLTRNLARLRDRGLIATTADPEDRRASRVVLTDTGNRAAAEVKRQEEAFADSVFRELPAGHADETLSALERLLEAVHTATERCCPGAFDHLMTMTTDSNRKGEIHGCTRC